MTDIAARLCCDAVVGGRADIQEGRADNGFWSTLRSTWNRSEVLPPRPGEFAAAAKHDGIKYRDLLHRILTLGMQRAAGMLARAEKA
jgi:hypothetical protein